MKIARKILDYFLHAAAFLLALFSILSLFRNSEIRFIKMFDFPRIQFFIVSLMIIILMGIVVKKWKWHSKVLLIMLFLGLVINGRHLINYTSLVEVDVPNAQSKNIKDDQINILISNVKMSNRESNRIIDIINKKNPDIFLAMETDQWWDDQFKFMKRNYPYFKRTINDQTYGMILYSKFPMDEVQVDYLNNKKVPSFQTNMHLRNDKVISFHSVHPVPPNYFEDLPDNEGKKAKELEKIGKIIDNINLPILIAGDLNDVVWSQVDDLTITKDKLHDVRVGRGFYNSFNAQNFIMRWPLDHIFVSKEFKLKKLERLEKIGSDHFPIYAELILESNKN